jgi:thioredoxin reductase (NADPH)
MTLGKKKAWDCVIVGAGPAGLSAAVYMGRFRRSTLVLDGQDGRWSYGQVNDNYLGFPRGVRARRLHALGRAQAERFGVTFWDTLVTGLQEKPDGYRIEFRGGQAQARTVIWAAGVRDRWPAIPGVRRLVGRHLFWCIVCDGWRTLGRSVLLLGNTDRDVVTALQFLTYTRDLTFVMDRGRTLNARCRKKLDSAGVPVRCGRVKRVQASEERIERVVLDDGAELRPDYIFSLYGSDPRTELLRALPVALTRFGHVRIDEKNRTNLPTFFAAGDVTDKYGHQVATAVHEGAMAAMAANHVLYPPHQRL